MGVKDIVDDYRRKYAKELATTSYSLIEDGFEIVRSVLTENEVDDLRHALSVMKVAPGHRSLMRQVPEVAALAVAPEVLSLLTRLLGAEPFPVRSIFFDKTPEANWLVPWHQDLTIALKTKLDLPGYGPWSIKEGVPHVQPPVELLQSMVTIRLHLDDCDESNGALRVIPGSHRSGKLPAAKIAEIRSQKEEVICVVQSGDAVLMHPLLLHASSEAQSPLHRRVVHLEYATYPLPAGLDWAESA
jgi:ectoine hydroxylase-related dioxygenase (phytanoyl-CoA dioxygenase family)